MIINEKLQQAIHQQINAELYSAYLYLAMAAHLERVNMPGAAQWMKVQFQEEIKHAMKFFDFVVERGGEVQLEAIAKPPTSWKSVQEVFQEAYQHEQHVTSLIYHLVDLAQAEKDHATSSFLKWFVDEQVEEEASVDEILKSLERIGESRGSLYMLDRQLGKRDGE